MCRNCFALARSETLARVMLRRCSLEGETSLAELARRRPYLRVHEFGCVGGIADTLRAQSWYTMSEYFDDIPIGNVGPHGVRCEDLTRLTFPDECFDVVVSQDVMEHVPDPFAAFSEIARVLRAGGSHIFTVPQDRSLRTSVRRAKRDLNGIEHNLPPEYHGDPVRAEGALVFTDFGTDLEEMLQNVGLRLIEHELPILGGGPEQLVRVFEAAKDSGYDRSAHAQVVPVN